MRLLKEIIIDLFQLNEISDPMLLLRQRLWFKDEIVAIDPIFEYATERWRRYCVGFTVLFGRGQQYTIRVENVYDYYNGRTNIVNITGSETTPEQKLLISLITRLFQTTTWIMFYDHSNKLNITSPTMAGSEVIVIKAA